MRSEVQDRQSTHDLKLAWAWCRVRHHSRCSWLNACHESFKGSGILRADAYGFSPVYAPPRAYTEALCRPGDACIGKDNASPNFVRDKVKGKVIQS